MKHKTLHILVFCLMFFHYVIAGQVNVEELKTIVRQSRENVQGGICDVVFIETFDDFRFSDTEFDNVSELTFSHRHSRLELVLDISNNMSKAVISDLRDVTQFAKDHNIPDDQKVNISLTRTALKQNNYDVIYNTHPANPNTGKGSLDIASSPPGNYSRYNMIYLGILRENLLKPENSPVISTMIKDNKELIKITVNNNEFGSTGTAVCDPALGYRFTRIEWKKDNRLLRETVAEDYRLIGDTAYPFYYSDKYYDPNGNVIIQTTYQIENISFRNEPQINDFKIFVPQGTEITDTVISMKVFDNPRDAYLDVDDILSLCVAQSQVP